MEEKQIIWEFRQAIADNLLASFNVGDTVPHKWLQDQIGLTFQNIDTMENHHTFNKMYGTHRTAIIHLVRERGSRLLVSVKSKGYLLINPIDHFSIGAVRSIKAIIREHTRLEDSLDCIDYPLLASIGIGENHPKIVADREARAWIDNWVRQLFSEDRPERIKELVDEAAISLNEIDTTRYEPDTESSHM
jgi:hypothetical protein